MVRVLRIRRPKYGCRACGAIHQAPAPEPERPIAKGLLIDARDRADLTQQTLARRLGKPQSFVAKYDGGERRLDVIEFIVIARAIGADPIRLLRKLVGEIA